MEPLRTSRQYDLKDRLTYEMNEGGAVTQYLYDQNDRLIKEIRPYGEEEKTGGGAGTVYRYDSRGNRIQEINGFNQVVEEREYNLQDKPLVRRKGLGDQTGFRYTLDGQIQEVRVGQGERQKPIQQYEYNARGQIIGIIDGVGEKVCYDTDSWGRITGIGFSDGVKESYEYTPSGQVCCAVDGKGQMVRYRYNSLGKVRERVDQSGDKETFQYDEEGNLMLHTDRDGNQVFRTYNVFGNPVYEKATDGEGGNACITTYRYDSLGRLVHAVCDGHSYEYVYHEQGGLKEKRSSGKRLVSYEYDKAGQIIRMKDPAGVTTCYEYDILGRTRRIFTEDRMEVSYGYDCLNRLERIGYGNGVETRYQYDGDGNVSHMESRAGKEKLFAFTYEYDGNGNRTSKTGEQRLGGGESIPGNRVIKTTYQYNVRGQLLEESRNGEAYRYTYDAVGNRIRMESPEGETGYHYNEKNQLICKEEIAEEGIRGKRVFTYSRQGSILKEEGTSGIRRFIYNSKNQQIKVEREDGQVQVNRYDSEGLRCEMRENEKLLRFVYHRGELLYEGGEEEQSSYHHGNGIDAIQKDQNTYYYHRDEQLSTALITDKTGRIRNSYQYDAFGKELEKTEGISNRIRYTGQQYDGITGQYYLRARYYNPILGRFMQEDANHGDGLNLYAYCDNNPVMYYDPSGYTGEGNQTGCSLTPGNGGDGGEGGVELQIKPKIL